MEKEEEEEEGEEEEVQWVRPAVLSKPAIYISSHFLIVRVGDELFYRCF